MPDSKPPAQPQPQPQPQSQRQTPAQQGNERAAVDWVKRQAQQRLFTKRNRRGGIR
jgi:hypothetical protein